MQSFFSGPWVCARCAAGLHTQIRSYAGNSAGRSSLSARPQTKRLSKNVARHDLGSGRSSRTPELVKRDAPARVPKPSSSRITKTGVSVLTDIPLHEKLTGKGNKPQEFGELSLSTDLVKAIHSAALYKLEYAIPTNIQSLAIPAMLRASSNPDASSFLLAAETGSGKTLAYLAPILQMLKQEETEQRVQRTVGKPRCVIILPSTELVRQVGFVVKAMSHLIKLSSSILLPEYSFRRSKNQVLMSPVDILVTMPHRLMALVEEGIVSMEETRYLVIDEADTLLDLSFADLVRPLIEKSRNKKCLVFCSATIPRSVDSYLRNQYKDIQRIVSPKIHTIPRRIATKFVDVAKEYNGDKSKALHQILRDLSLDSSEPGKVKKVIVFVNKREKVPEVAEFVKSKGFEGYAFSRDLPDRSQVIAQFLDFVEGEEVKDGEQVMKVLITTDLASRGIDTTPVKNVVIYDTPDSTIDLLHRIGRTGRAGRRGTAYVLLGKKRGEAWVHEVRQLSITGQPLI